MHFRILATLLLVSGLGLPWASAENNLQSTRDVLDKWVETRQIISQEKSDWRTEEAILADTKELLNQELKRLSQAIEDLEASATEVDQEREKLAAERESLLDASSVVTANIGQLEDQIRAILNTLPAPLTERIRPIIRRLPDDSENASLALGERVQNIVAILSQADQFNSNITQTSESREMPDGKVVEVRTLYWGLATAFYVDATGSFAGVGLPGEDGWEWPEIEGAAPNILRLLDVYEGSADIQFVEVPAFLR